MKKAMRFTEMTVPNRGLNGVNISPIFIMGNKQNNCINH